MTRFQVENPRAARRDAGLTQTALARRAGLRSLRIFGSASNFDPSREAIPL